MPVVVVIADMDSAVVQKRPGLQNVLTRAVNFQVLLQMMVELLGNFPDVRAWA
jgi:hypothetical protein